MGLFFKSAPIVPAVSKSLEEALTTQSESVDNPEQMAAELATQIDQQVSGKFSWGRLACAIGLLVAIFVAGIWTAHDSVPEVKEWSKILLHSFELLLGAVIGLITGEAVAKH